MTKSLSFYFDGFAILDLLMGHKIAIKRRLGTDIRIVTAGGGVGSFGSQEFGNDQNIKKIWKLASILAQKHCKSMFWKRVK